MGVEWRLEEGKLVKVMVEYDWNEEYEHQKIAEYVDEGGDVGDLDTLCRWMYGDEVTVRGYLPEQMEKWGGHYLIERLKYLLGNVVGDGDRRLEK